MEVEKSREETLGKTEKITHILKELGPRTPKKKAGRQKKEPETAPVEEQTKPSLEQVVDMTPLRTVAVSDPTLDILDRLVCAQTEIDAGMNKVNEFFARIPATPSHEAVLVAYRETPAQTTLHPSDKRSVNLSLDITTTGGFLGFGTKTRQATLTVKTELAAYSMSYVIPQKNKLLAQEVATHIVSDIQRIVHQERYIPAEETAFVESIGTFIGSPQIVQDYFTSLYAQLRVDLQDNIKNILRDAETEIGSVMEQVRKNIPNITGINTVEVQALLAEKQKQAEANLTQHYNTLLNEVQEKLKAYEAEHTKGLEVLRKKLEKEYEQKHAALEEERARFKQERKEYEKRTAELETALEEDSFKILPGLERIFKNCDIDKQTFMTKIDHDLRVLYMIKFKTDLKKHNEKSEHVSIPVALSFLELLYQKWVPQNSHANAQGFKETYASFRAILNYLHCNKIQPTILLERLRTLNYTPYYFSNEKGMRIRQSNAEEVVEYLLGEDVDLNKYGKDLHNMNATNKQELGVL